MIVPANRWPPNLGATATSASTWLCLFLGHWLVSFTTRHSNGGHKQCLKSHCSFGLHHKVNDLWKYERLRPHITANLETQKSGCSKQELEFEDMVVSVLDFVCIALKDVVR